MDGLTIGRIVHYRPRGLDACRAAIVTDVSVDADAPLDPLVNVVSFAATGEQVAALDVPYVQPHRNGGEGWHWPRGCA